MMAQWKEITSMEEWTEALSKSVNKPLLIMKHSTTCPISANAWREFQSYLNDGPKSDVEYVMVKVIESRNVSNQIANDLNVRHQSPQLILVKNKGAIWNTSHWDITQENIRQAIQ